MKFAVVAVCTFALAMSVQGSVIPWGPWGATEIAGHGLSYTAVSGPSVAVAPWGLWGNGPVWAHGPAAVTVAQSPAVVAHAPAVVAAAPAVVVAHGPAHEGQYIAKTRGAVHTAPLAGHVQSVASINAAPAPGTV